MPPRYPRYTPSCFRQGEAEVWYDLTPAIDRKYGGPCSDCTAEYFAEMRMRGNCYRLKRPLPRPEAPEDDDLGWSGVGVRSIA
jgi:hypothetical protein